MPSSNNRRKFSLHVDEHRGTMRMKEEAKFRIIEQTLSIGMRQKESRNWSNSGNCRDRFSIIENRSWKKQDV